MISVLRRQSSSKQLTKFNQDPADEQANDNDSEENVVMKPTQ